MKENIIISSLAVLILALGIALVYEPNDKEIYASTNNEIVTENSLAMMYETEAGSGEYEVVDDTTWPLEGYIHSMPSYLVVKMEVVLLGMKKQIQY